jgi:hypothetical protein
MPKEDIEAIRLRKHPLAFEQEYEAKFVDWSGKALFAKEKLLVDGEPVDFPQRCDYVLAVIDTAVKSGQQHDGTGVLFSAYSNFSPTPLVLLDYDLLSIDGALLEQWLPSIFARLETYARKCGARFGSIGVYIEDAAAGSILLQQCESRGWAAQPLPSELTSVGKDGRALNAVDPVFRGEVKFSRYAYEKNIEFKEAERNHLVSQIFGFRIGDKEAYKRSDDLLDCFTYTVAITLGNSKGIA